MTLIETRDAQIQVLKRLAREQATLKWTIEVQVAELNRLNEQYVLYTEKVRETNKKIFIDKQRNKA